jgi:hypothetical protein
LRAQTPEGTVVWFDESLGRLARVSGDVADWLVAEDLAEIPSPWELCSGSWQVNRRAGLGDVLCLSAVVRELRLHGGTVEIRTHPNYAPLFPTPETPAVQWQSRVKPVNFNAWLERHPGRKRRSAAQCMADYWNLDLKDARPEVLLTPDEVAYGKALAAEYRHGDSPLVAVFAYAGWETRRWTGFLQVAKSLASQGCAVLGYSEEVLPCCKRPPKQGVRDLAALLAACDLVVTGDSGPMHLAAGVGVPSIAVFCCTNGEGSVGAGYQTDVLEPEGLDCWPCWSASCQVGELDVPGSCVRAVTPEQVVEKATERLASRADTSGGSP